MSYGTGAVWPVGAALILERKTVAARVSKFLQRAYDGARTVVIQVDRVDSGSSNLAHLRGGDGGAVHGVNVPLEGRAELDVELVVERLEVLRAESAWVFSHKAKQYYATKN